MSDICSIMGKYIVENVRAFFEEEKKNYIYIYIKGYMNKRMNVIDRLSEATGISLGI